MGQTGCDRRPGRMPCRRVSAPKSGQALTAFHTYCANRLGLTLEWYRRDTGEASYRFRPRTDAERQEWADGVTEDHI